MIERIVAFLIDLDESLEPHTNGGILQLYHIGRSALVWHYAAQAVTRDFDFLQSHGDNDLVRIALELFGKGTPKAVQHDLYLERVFEGLPPAPSGYTQRATEVNGSWKNLKVYRLESHDFAATKLRRFEAKDRSDIRFLCDLGELDPDRLAASLALAFPFNLDKDGDDFRDVAFANLEVVRKYLRGESDTL